MQLVSLPYKMGGNTQEMESTERKTANLLEPLTMDRLEDGSYGPSTYSEYCIYKDAVCPVTHIISLCSPCPVSLGRRDFHKYSKRSGFDMLDIYPEELAVLNPLGQLS